MIIIIAITSITCLTCQLWKQKLGAPPSLSGPQSHCFQPCDDGSDYCDQDDVRDNDDDDGDYVDYCSLTVLMSHVTTIAPSRANLHRNHQRHHHNCCHDQKQDQHDIIIIDIIKIIIDNDHFHLWHISLPMPDPPPVTRTTCPLMSLWNTCTANCDLWLVKFLERPSS